MAIISDPYSLLEQHRSYDLGDDFSVTHVEHQGNSGWILYWKAVSVSWMIDAGRRGGTSEARQVAMQQDPIYHATIQEAIDEAVMVSESEELMGFLRVTR